MLVVPSAARVACWLNAWIAQRASADAVIAGLVGGDGEVEFAGVSPGSRLAPALFLGELKHRDVRRVSATLPSPGNLVGLGGPPEFNASAIEAGSGVVLEGAGMGLVPHHLGEVTRWSACSATPPTYLPDVATADRELRATLLEAADALAELDVASWSPDAADAVLNLRAPAKLDTELPLASSQASGLIARALRAREIVTQAQRDDGGAVSASQVAFRRELLAPLHRAACAGVVAAASTIDGR
ncbi:MAG: hypothetical protein ACRDQA_08155 [Nocardioidaceae bacterium]